MIRITILRRRVWFAVDRVSRTYPDGGVTALRGRVARHSPRRIRGHHGAERQRQIDAAESAGHARSARRTARFTSRTSRSRRLRNLDRFRSQKIGFVFQSFYLLPTLTAVENVQIPMFEGPLRARLAAQRAAKLLDSVGMSHRAEPSADAAFGRRTAARGDRPGAGQRAARCCWPTSRPATSTRAPGAACSICSTTCTASAA